ncbi:MAG: aldolase/citrate lyase family protein [Vicinamibacteria bacterium]
MRSRLISTVACRCLIGSAAFVLARVATAQTEVRKHHNPVIDLLEQKNAVFGLYAPSNRHFTPPGAPTPTPAPPKTALELAKEAVAYKSTDYIFDGSMEGDYEKAFPVFAEFAKAMSEAGIVAKTPVLRLTHPLIVKMNEIAPDPAKAAERISRQLDLGVSGVMFVGVESPDEVKAGLAAMRYKSKGGTRADSVGSAPALWGMSEKEYREKADLWPLNPKGELVNWTIVESKVGLAHIREIAAVKGIGVLFPGAGTLRQVFTSTNDKGEKVVDTVGWEAAIQQVLAACKEFNVPCGYPARADDIEMRMKQGFSVFVINWGEPGFKTIDIGRKLAGRPATNP